MGIIALADALKPGSPAGVAELQRLGLEVVMFTGDNRRAARFVCRPAGHCAGGGGNAALETRRRPSGGSRLRERRWRWWATASTTRRRWLRPTVGLAVSAGADVALESADVTLMGSDLKGVITALSLSRQTLRAIKQNLFWAFFYNVLLIPVAAGRPLPGICRHRGACRQAWSSSSESRVSSTRSLAALAMAFSSVTVVSNSLRLRQARV